MFKRHVGHSTASMQALISACKLLQSRPVLYVGLKFSDREGWNGNVHVTEECVTRRSLRGRFAREVYGWAVNDVVYDFPELKKTPFSIAGLSFLSLLCVA